MSAPIELTKPQLETLLAAFRVQVLNAVGCYDTGGLEKSYPLLLETDPDVQLEAMMLQRYGLAFLTDNDGASAEDYPKLLYLTPKGYLLASHIVGGQFYKLVNLTDVVNLDNAESLQEVLRLALDYGAF